MSVLNDPIPEVFRNRVVVDLQKLTLAEQLLDSEHALP